MCTCASCQVAAAHHPLLLKNYVALCSNMIIPGFFREKAFDQLEELSRVIVETQRMDMQTGWTIGKLKGDTEHDK